MGGGTKNYFGNGEFVMPVGCAGGDVEEMARNVHLRLGGEVKAEVADIFRYSDVGVIEMTFSLRVLAERKGSGGVGWGRGNG